MLTPFLLTRKRKEYSKSTLKGLLVQFHNKSTRPMREICPKLTIMTAEQRQFYRSVVYIVSFEQTSQLILIFLLLTLNR